jgi:Fe-S oxidoreductase
MCPSYKYTRDRVQSPKGRAGMLREWIRLQSQENPQIHNAIEAPDNDKDFAKDVYESLSTCLSCKACASQCPIKVDIPEMKAEFLYSYHTRYARPRRDKLMPYLEKVLPLMAKAPKFFNGMQKTSMARGASKALFNVVDLPDLSPVSLQKGLKQRKAPHWDVAALAMLPVQEKEKSVVLVQDTFTTYYDAEIVLAHYDLLQKLGYTVYVTPYRPNGKPLHVKGFLAQFDRLAAANDAFYAEVAATGVDMVGIEAAVTLMFRQEYNQRLENRPRYTIYQFQEWLAAQLSKGVVSPPVLAAPAQAYRLFSHCTEKTAIPASPALWGQIFKAFAIDLVPEKTGCCGMSGMFGHEAEHQEMSRGLFEMSWKDKVEAAGADRMLATGFSCRCQTKRFADFKPKHPVQALLAACMP